MRAETRSSLRNHVVLELEGENSTTVTLSRRSGGVDQSCDLPRSALATGSTSRYVGAREPTDDGRDPNRQEPLVGSATQAAPTLRPRIGLAVDVWKGRRRDVRQLPARSVFRSGTLYPATRLGNLRTSANVRALMESPGAPDVPDRVRPRRRLRAGFGASDPCRGAGSWGRVLAPSGTGGMKCPVEWLRVQFRRQDLPRAVRRASPRRDGRPRRGIPGLVSGPDISARRGLRHRAGSHRTGPPRRQCRRGRPRRVDDRRSRTPGS